MLKDIFVYMDLEEKCVIWGHERGREVKENKKEKKFS